MSKVDEMKVQRADLASQLRDAVHGDDVTKRLVAFADSSSRGGTESEEERRQAFFDNELKKFEPQVKLLRQNMLAQENIVRALTEANANFAETRYVKIKVL